LSPDCVPKSGRIARAHCEALNSGLSLCKPSLRENFGTVNEGSQLLPVLRSAPPSPSCLSLVVLKGDLPAPCSRRGTVDSIVPVHGTLALAAACVANLVAPCHAPVPFTLNHGTLLERVLKSNAAPFPRGDPGLGDCPTIPLVSAAPLSRPFAHAHPSDPRKYGLHCQSHPPRSPLHGQSSRASHPPPFSRDPCLRSSR
jgi:hypothetical protein